MAEIVGAHLVGSAPVTEPGELFDLVAEHLPGHLKRIPDGEVGQRDTWIAWQYPKLAECPQLEAKRPDSSYGGRELMQFELVDGASDVQLVDLGYAEAALDSWEKFREAKAAGSLPPNARFMVGLPSPLSVVSMYVAPAARPVVFSAWTKAMKAEAARIVEAIPNDELAIQWEVCIEFGMLAGIWTYLDTDLTGDDAKPEVAEHLLELGQQIPEPVELGYHLCYGDAGHKHFTEPVDTAHLSWATSTILDGVDRSVQWIHMPVPRDRNDVAYFEPLAAVELPVGTDLYLGLVHESGGVEGTQSRIEAASQIVPRFGVATECGLGRRDLATVGPLLAQHALVSNPLKGEQ